MPDNSLLREKISSGFQTSAYRGVTGALHPTEADDCATGRGLRLAQMISDKLEPFPSVKSAPYVKDVFKPTTINNKAFTFKDESRAIVLDFPYQASTTGVVPNGLHDSTGFLETLSSTQRMSGRFDDEVMEAYRRGKEKEAELERERQALHDAPMGTANPNGFAKSTHEHSNMSNVDSAAYRAQYRTKHELVTKVGAANREKASKQISEGNGVCTEALEEFMKASHNVSLPRGYKPPSTKLWETTTKHHHAPYDKDLATEANARFATKPVPNRNQMLAPHEEAAFDRTESSHSRRHEGGYATEHSEQFSNKIGEACVVADHRTKGVLNLVNGVFTMRHQYDHPRADVKTGCEYKPSQIVPGQFKPMSREPLHAKD